MIWQKEIILSARGIGLHDIGGEIQDALPSTIENGILFMHLMHTSAALTVNENYDPDVLRDMDLYLDHLAPQHLKGIRHTMEGPDDMPAHVKSSLFGVHLSLPLKNGQPLLGQWQGIFLCEFRTQARARKLFLSILY
jgi:secondary thiamine-phosphate synthase enzyme